MSSAGAKIGISPLVAAPGEIVALDARLVLHAAPNESALPRPVIRPLSGAIDRTSGFCWRAGFAVTNGVHAATSVSPAFAELLDRHISGWKEDNLSLRDALGISKEVNTPEPPMEATTWPRSTTSWNTR